MRENQGFHLLNTNLAAGSSMVSVNYRVSIVWNTTFSKILALKVNLIGKFDPISLSLVTFVICLLEKKINKFT